MELYLDVILIENFIVDLFLLIISFNVIRIKVSIKRLILGSVMGSFYTIVMLVKELKFFSGMIFQFLVAFFIVLIAVGIRRWRVAIKSWIIFLFSSFILSGVCYYLCQKELEYSFVSGTHLNNLSSKNIIISLMIIYILVERILTFIKEKSFISNFIYKIEINIDNKKYVARGFLDTGNELREPITNLPCILVERDVFKNLSMPKDEVFYINYSAIGYDGKLIGYKVDSVKIYCDKKDNFKEIKAIVCPCKEVLNKDREFNALLSRGVI